ncbi:hypothetical protein QTG54_011390 [Skeletonema marinoi]|uniref:Uncharacterized protein n=1 Tax=Skeletonema marinoi TaxID=267567 RepID=A0AAD8Y1X3_9STRA|nr:hypothetical protein QTG54_011390 [Skeletonema marinoi]
MPSTQRSRFLLAAGFLAAAAAEASDEPPIDIPSDTELQFSADPYADQDKLDMIKSGIANLAAIRYEASSFSSENTGYTGVYGDFCVYDARLNYVEDPSLYPTIDDMMLTSDHCGEHTYTLPLAEVVAAVSSHDINVGQTNPPVDGLLFHLGHSGAGVVSNALATFETTLVVPEHPAITDALFACDHIHNRHESADCSSSLQKKLVEDVINLATRSSDASITHAYIKFNADSTAYISMVRDILPHAPWTFHYRDSDTTLAKSTQANRNSCVFKRRQPSSFLAQKAILLGIDLDGMSQEDLCALYLSTLFEVAINEYENSETGMLVSYAQLVEAGYITDVVLPFLGLQAEIDADPAMVSANVETTLTTKSNTRGVPGNKVQHWNANDEVIHISDKVRAASALFLGNAMEVVERL